MKRTGHSRERRIKRYSFRWVGDEKKSSTTRAETWR